MVSHVKSLTELLQQQTGVLVSVDDSQGSVPREKGTWMAVFAESVLGTIGGGHLEFQAIDIARQRLTKPGGDELLRFALGPSLGQCCGGVVHLRFETVEYSDIDSLRQRLQSKNQSVALFGGGHVGTALVKVLSLLPFDVHWIDSRDEIFPAQLPVNVICEHSDPVDAAVDTLSPQSRVLIMSFSHAEDLDVVAACLRRHRAQGDLPYIGLIGSKTKWATFRHRLVARGFSEEELAHITCPIGVPGIPGKEPEVIAVAVAAQLLQQTFSG